MKIIQASIDGVKGNPETKDYFVDIYWENEEGEFGHIWIYSSGEKPVIDSEHMSRDFVKQVFEKLVDDATFEI
jgi:hypothetical protein